MFNRSTGYTNENIANHESTFSGGAIGFKTNDQQACGLFALERLLRVFRNVYSLTADSKIAMLDLAIFFEDRRDLPCNVCWDGDRRAAAKAGSVDPKDRAISIH